MHSDNSLKIEHFGVRGMRWGVRKRSAAQESERAKKFGGKKTKEMSEDAQRAADTFKKSKEKSISSLTNKEIQEFNNRMNLERQFNSLAPLTGTKAVQRFVSNQLSLGKTANEVIAFSNSPAGAAIKAGFN